MKQPKPVPTEPPFITFYTPTFRRPESLARCMKSVAVQTARDRVEQIIVPDHVGLGLVGGLFKRIPWYAEACRGDYVHILADDDVLVEERIVEKLIAFAEKNSRPAVIVTNVIKGGFELPSCDPLGTPVVSEVDLSCYILRRDVWVRHAADYGDRYEGDFDHALTVHRAGYPTAYFDALFVEGGASNGRPEVDWP